MSDRQEKIDECVKKNKVKTVTAERYKRLGQMLKDGQATLIYNGKKWVCVPISPEWIDKED